MKTQKYCSMKCYTIDMKNRPRKIKRYKIICEYCNKEFFVIKSRKLIAKYCSRSCLAKGRKITKERKIKISFSARKNWQNKEFREKALKAMWSGSYKRPTSLEKQFIELIKELNLPYKYTGNGSCIIGYKNPDFININGQKICIEVRNRIVCEVFSKITPEEYKKQRIKHFSKFGWKCLVFFEDELNIDNILMKLRGFRNG